MTERDEATGRRAVTQPVLFEMGTDGRLVGNVGVLPELTTGSSLDVARYWFRRYLEQSEHPKNTVNSYSYDLALFQLLIGPKAIDQVTRRDVAHFLDDSRTRSTRKRRLTSVSGFFKFLIQHARVLRADPSAEFFPEHIPLKTPRPLFVDEQARLLAAAEADGPRAQAAIWLMLRLGLTRAEVLQLQADHIDRSLPERPVVFVYYDSRRHRGRERHLAASAELSGILEKLDVADDGPKLIPILPQSLNKLVERVAKAAGFERPVSPQTLRDTFAVDQARAGAGEDDLLRLLGLADDARNRLSVRRYLKLAEPPLLGQDVATNHHDA